MYNITHYFKENQRLKIEPKKATKSENKNINDNNLVVRFMWIYLFIILLPLFARVNFQSSPTPAHKYYYYFHTSFSFSIYNICIYVDCIKLGIDKMKIQRSEHMPTKVKLRGER